MPAVRASALAGTWLAFLLPLIGLGLLFLALLPDDAEERMTRDPRSWSSSPSSTTRRTCSARGSRRPAAPSRSCHPYAGDAVPDPRRLRRAAGAWAARWAPTTTSVLDWIGPVKELIRDAVAEGVPTLGICLGHQLMGAALGGRVDPQPARPAGRAARRSAGPTRPPSDRLFGGLATPRRGVQWNYDLVVEPPPGAVVLAQTADGEVAGRPLRPDAPGASSCTPRSTRPIVGTWVTDSERAELADRGLDADALLAEIKEARAELDQAWAPLAAGFADVALGPGRRRCRPVEPPDDDQGQPDPARLPGPRAGAGAAWPSSRRAAEPLLALLGRTADPDLALASLVRLVEAAGAAESELLLRALVDDEGTAMRLLSVLGASEALADHLCRHPEHWRELTDPTLGSTRPAAYAVREDLLRAVGADPHDADADRDPARRARPSTRCGSSTAGSCSAWPPATSTHHLGVDDAAAELVRPRRRHPRRRAGRRPAAGRGRAAELARLAVIAMGKCGGHELNYVSDVDVIFVHEPVEGADDDAWRSRRPPSWPAT